MYAMYYIYICIFVCLIFVTRLCFMIFYTRKVNNKRVIRNGPAKTMIILGSGGHTAEMIRILRYLHFNNYSPRTYVYADTDETSMEKVKMLEGSNTDYKTIKVRRCREIHQSYYMSIFTTLRSTLESIPLYWSERPELLLCNGPGTCVPLCIIAFLFKLLYITKTTIIFVESFCRVKTMSLTGKILYYLTDYQILQWPYLHKPDNDNNKTLYF